MLKDDTLKKEQTCACSSFYEKDFGLPNGCTV